MVLNQAPSGAQSHMVHINMKEDTGFQNHLELAYGEAQGLPQLHTVTPQISKCTQVYKTTFGGLQNC